MGKHIIDGPRKAGTSDRLEHFARLDREESGVPGEQSRNLLRASRKDSEGERLRRFTEIERRGD